MKPRVTRISHAEPLGLRRCRTRFEQSHHREREERKHRISRRTLGCENNQAGAAAFTLLELVLVLGLMAALVGTFALALRETDGPALASAQSMLAGITASARA